MILLDFLTKIKKPNNLINYGYFILVIKNSYIKLTICRYNEQRLCIFQNLILMHISIT